MAPLPSLIVSRAGAGGRHSPKACSVPVPALEQASQAALCCWGHSSGTSCSQPPRKRPFIHSPALHPNLQREEERSPTPELICSLQQLSHKAERRQGGKGHPCPWVLPLPTDLPCVCRNTQSALLLPFGDPSVTASTRETKASKAGSPTVLPQPLAPWRSLLAALKCYLRAPRGLGLNPSGPWHSSCISPSYPLPPMISFLIRTRFLKDFQRGSAQQVGRQSGPFPMLIFRVMLKLSNPFLVLIWFLNGCCNELS